MVSVQTLRTEVVDYRKKEFINDFIPTLTVKSAARFRGEDIDILAGSHRIGQGSSFLLTYLSIQSGSPECWWVLTHEGTPLPGEKRGTIDVGYFEAKGVDTRLADKYAPVKAIGPGTMRVRILSAGSAKWYGAAFEGIEL